MNRLLLVLALILMISGCRTKEKIIHEYVNSVDSVVVERRVVDTMIVHEADTATLRMLAECDEHGTALIHIIDELKGTRVDITPKIEYIAVKDTTGMVRYDAYVTMEAIAQGFADKISILEERAIKYKAIIAQKDEEISKKQAFSLNSLITGAIGGFCVAVVLFAYAMLRRQ